MQNTRHRNIKNEDEITPEYHLYEELAILIGNKSILKVSSDPISISLRCVILAELLLTNKIGLQNNKVIIKEDTQDFLLHKTILQLKKASLNIKEWLAVLNGENLISKYKLQLKKVRHIVYKKLEEQNKLIFKSNIYNLKVTITDNLMRNSLINKLIKHLIEKNVDLHWNVIVCNLYFCNALENIFITLPISKQRLCKNRVDDIINGFKEVFIREDEMECIISTLMREYLKKKLF